MELKNVIKKIMESEDLKSRLRSLGSFDEVYEFFVANGYEGNVGELKEKLFGKSAKFSVVKDDDLSKVAGGVSGRQVLSACTGFMMLMGMSPFTNLQGHASNTPLHVAVKEGNPGDIKGSFEKNHDAINEEDENGLTSLHHAVRNKDLDKVKYLVEHGADVNARCFRELYNAYETQNDEEWQRLRNDHPDWNGQECGTTPLHDAVEKDDFEIVKYLVEHGADVNAQTTIGRENALHVAVDAENFNMDLIRYLVEHGADINAEDWYGRNTLNLALECLTDDRNDKIDINLIKYLVENGADVKKEVHGYGVLYNVKDMEVIDYFLQHGADPNMGMWTAFVEHDMELLKYLVEHGADVNKKVLFSSETPLFDAWDSECIDYLIKHGADINARVEDGRTPLCKAVTYARADCFKCLIERGADINVKDNSGDTLLHMATQNYGNIEVVKYLVDHGLDVNAKDNYGRTPLSYAVGNCVPLSWLSHDDERYREFPEIVRYLVEHGADINTKDEYGLTLLGHTFDLDVSKYLVEHGVDTTNSLAPCFGRWMTARQFDLLKYLVEHGADVNATIEEDGSTQLHHVWDMEIVKYLVERGADVNAKDKQGKTPLDKALESDNIDKAKYLVNHGAHSSDSKREIVSLVWFGDVGVIDKAIENGANINECLSAAVLLGRTDLIDHLLEKGANVDYGLLGAGIAMNVNLVDTLLEKEGADVLVAVCGALLVGNVDFAKQLAEKDPEIELTDDKIKTFKDMVQEAATKEGLDVNKWQESLEKVTELISLSGIKK